MEMDVDESQTEPEQGQSGKAEGSENVRREGSEHRGKIGYAVTASAVLNNFPLSG